MNTNEILKRNLKALRGDTPQKAVCIELQKYGQYLSTSQLSKFENVKRKNTPDIYALEAFAKYFGVSMESLLNDVHYECNDYKGFSEKGMFDIEDNDHLFFTLEGLDSDFALDPNTTLSADGVQEYQALQYIEKNNLLPEEKIFSLKYEAFKKWPLLKGLCSELLAYKLFYPIVTIEDKEQIDYLINGLRVDEDEEECYYLDEEDIIYISDPSNYSYASTRTQYEPYSFFDNKGEGYILSNALSDYYECLVRILGIGDNTAKHQTKALTDMVLLGLNGNSFAREYLDYWLNLRTGGDYSKQLAEAKDALSKADDWAKLYIQETVKSLEETIKREAEEWALLDEEFKKEF